MEQEQARQDAEGTSDKNQHSSNEDDASPVLVFKALAPRHGRNAQAFHVAEVADVLDGGNDKFVRFFCVKRGADARAQRTQPRFTVHDVPGLAHGMPSPMTLRPFASFRPRPTTMWWRRAVV